MKELLIEEKAQRYDEALKVAKGLYAKGAPDSLHLERMFPVLKESEESEDERIRKSLIDFFSEPSRKNYILLNGFTVNDIIAWLEKQGEQTSSQTNERAWLYLVSDVLTWKDGIGQYLDDPRVQELAKKLCSEYAQKLYNPSVLSHSSNTGNNNQEPTDKVEQKWSEEDKKMIQDIINDIAIAQELVYCKSRCEDEITWLKSLKDRYTWKPSKEHMAALLVAVGDEKKRGSDVSKELYELYLQLKHFEL